MNIKKNFTILILFFAIDIYGQKINEETNMVLFSLDYASNINTFGVTNPVKQPIYISTFSYLSKHNFDINYSGILAGNSDSTYSKPTFEQSIFAGYTFKINNRWNVYPSYTHMFHSKNSYTLTSSFSDILQNDISYLGKYYNANLTTNYVFGEKGMFFCSLENSVNFTKDDFVIKNSSLNVQLGIYLNISDNNYYNELFYNEFDRDYFLAWVSESFYYMTYKIIQNRVFWYGLEDTKEFLKDEKPELFEPDYKLTSIDIYLPIYYSVKNFMFSATGILNIPTTKNIFYQIDNSFLLSFGISCGFEI